MSLIAGDCHLGLVASFCIFLMPFFFFLDLVDWQNHAGLNRWQLWFIMATSCYTEGTADLLQVWAPQPTIAQLNLRCACKQSVNRAQSHFAHSLLPSSTQQEAYLPSSYGPAALKISCQSACKNKKIGTTERWEEKCFNWATQPARAGPWWQLLHHLVLCSHLAPALWFGEFHLHRTALPAEVQTAAFLTSYV